MKFVDRVGQVWEGIDLVGWNGIHIVVRSAQSREHTRHTVLRVETGEFVNANEMDDWGGPDKGHGTWMRLE